MEWKEWMIWSMYVDEGGDEWTDKPYCTGWGVDGMGRVDIIHEVNSVD